jgi:hypothetical protein
VAASGTAEEAAEKKNQTGKLDVLSNDDSKSYERSFESETVEITTLVLFSAASLAAVALRVSTPGAKAQGLGVACGTTEVVP